jgi:hypothetical protein
MNREIDVHGMTKNEAQKAIETFIKNCPKDTNTVTVIHGYHGGTELKQMIQSRNGIRSKRIERKKYTMNQGETIFVLRRD